MKVQVTQLKGIAFAAKAESNHWVMIDGPEEFGGSSAGSRPMEFILFGFAGCSGSDIASILQKKRVKLDKFEINVEAEEAEDYPKVFTKIHLNFVFTGRELKEKDVERAIELSRVKYCPVWAMLKDVVEITYSYEIRESE